MSKEYSTIAAGGRTENKLICGIMAYRPRTFYYLPTNSASSEKDEIFHSRRRILRPQLRLLHLGLHPTLNRSIESAGIHLDDFDES